MNVSPEHEQDLLAMSDDRKWKLIRGNVRCTAPLGYSISPHLDHHCLQSSSAVALPPDYFVDQLRRHLDPELR